MLLVWTREWQVMQAEGRPGNAVEKESPSLAEHIDGGKRRVAGRC
jgi:hypothetical protein